MPYKDKVKQKQRQHELYLEEKQLLKQARQMLGLPLDRRYKKFVCKRCGEGFRKYGDFRKHIELHDWDNYDSGTMKNVTVTSYDKTVGDK